MARKHGQCREHAGINCVAFHSLSPNGSVQGRFAISCKAPWWTWNRDRILSPLPGENWYSDLYHLKLKHPPCKTVFPGSLNIKTGAGVSTTYQLEQPSCPKKNASWWLQAARKTAKRVPCAAGTGKRGILVVCCLCTNIWPRRLEFWIPIQPTWDPKGIYGDFLKWGIPKSP